MKLISRVGHFFKNAYPLDMIYSYQYFCDFLSTQAAGPFESYFIYWFYEVSFKRSSCLGWQKIAKVFDYINSVLISKDHIKRMGVLKIFKNFWPTLLNSFGVGNFLWYPSKWSHIPQERTRNIVSKVQYFIAV